MKMRADGERRALLESILDDPSASHAERLKADELLTELELGEQRRGVALHLTDEQALDELRSLAAAAPTWLAIAGGADGVEAPIEPGDLEAIIGLQQRVIGLLELRLAERERALQDRMVHRLLPPAPRLVLA